MDLAPVPTPTVLWREVPVLAIVAVPGSALGVLGEPSTASPAAWAATGAAIRQLHDAPLPPWPGPELRDVVTDLDRECEWLLANALLPADVIRRNRDIAEAALRPWRPAFIHGDLQIAHVFIERDEVVGIIDWSGASRGDAMFDLATLPLGHEERLEDLLASYGEGAGQDRSHPCSGGAFTDDRERRSDSGRGRARYRGGVSQEVRCNRTRLTHSASGEPGSTPCGGSRSS